MKILRTKAELRAQTRSWRGAGESIGVVPTMGALHEGHLSLVNAARARADRVIVTLFVNPRQFNNPDDLAKYPRTEESDSRILDPLGVDVLYLPDLDQMYPEGFATSVSVEGLTAYLCGATRPGHFDGVATVVAKLLLQTDADFAFFGEKDFQQLQVVRRMVMDLDIPTEIVGCSTIREDSGLALSSRNLRLGEDALAQAPAIYATLGATVTAIRDGGGIEASVRAAGDRLKQAGIGPIDYLELRRESDLARATDLSTPARLFVAAWLDGVRLIDNVPV
tara:strand:+ start:6990 stop:7826 length:837 start_codon:yes stop_codon:yes gene_type:complete